MNTKQAKYKTDIARLAEDMAKRDIRMLIAVISVMALGLAVLRFMQTSAVLPDAKLFRLAWAVR